MNDWSVLVGLVFFISLLTFLFADAKKIKVDYKTERHQFEFMKLGLSASCIPLNSFAKVCGIISIIALVFGVVWKDDNLTLRMLPLTDKFSFPVFPIVFLVCAMGYSLIKGIVNIFQKEDIEADAQLLLVSVPQEAFSLDGVDPLSVLVEVLTAQRSGWRFFTMANAAFCMNSLAALITCYITGNETSSTLFFLLAAHPICCLIFREFFRSETFAKLWKYFRRVVAFILVIIALFMVC